MKSFKKVLCLVLVVVMALGVSTVAFAGNLDNFKDADKAVAPYAEAVDVLIGLKVVNGVTTTDLALDQAYTREQAAKVIAYLVLGQKAADALSTTSAPFADVEASRWSAGYIAFCVKQGIIAGYDATTFGPTDGLTGYQFAKMLLTAVGYGKNNEYVGEGWSINVAKDALALDIFEGDLSAATNAQISRKQAMLMAFNTLINVPTVNYNANFQTYYTGGNFTNGVWEIDEYNKSDRAYALTLGYTVFGLQVEDGYWDLGDPDDEDDDVFVPNTDGYGRIVRNWTINNTRTDVSDEHNEAPDYTFTGKVSYKNLYETLGKTVAGYSISYRVDGQADTALTDLVANKTSTSAVATTGASATTEVYVNVAARTVSIVVINNYFAEVATVDEDEETADFNVYTDTGVFVTDTFDTTDFEEEDCAFVNMYKDGANWVITKAVAAEEVKGVEVTSVSDTKYVKVGSTTYNMAAMLVEAIANDDFSAGNKYTLYLDNFDNVIGAKLYSEAADAGKYLYVDEFDADVYGAISGNAYVKIAANFTDGTSKVVNLYVKDATKATASIKALNGTGYTKIAEDGDDVVTVTVPDGFYSYTVNSDGLYNLKAIANVDNVDTIAPAKISWTKGNAAVTLTDNTPSSARFTSSSKLVLVDDQVTYTGYSKFPASADVIDTDSNILYILKDGKISTIYVFGNKGAKSEVTFARGNAYVESDADYDYFTFYVDGKSVEYKFSKDTLSSTGFKGKMGSIEVDSKGVATFDEFTNESGDEYLTVSGTIASVDDGYIITEDGLFYLGDDDTDCEVYNVKDGIKTGSLAKNGNVDIVYSVDSGDNFAYVIYVK